MRALILLLATAACAALAFDCAPCSCNETDETNVFCELPRAKLKFEGRTNEYVKVSCTGTNFTCADLPTLNFGNNQTLSSIGVTTCPPHFLRCINQTLQAAGTSLIYLSSVSEPLEVEDVAALGDVINFIIKDGAETRIPVSSVAIFPNLRSLRVSDTAIRLYSDDFLGFPPIIFLELSSTQLTEIPDNAFNGLSKLTILHLWNNNLTEIGLNAFRGLDSLKTLTLNRNNISSIPPGCLAHTPSLKSIEVKMNPLRELTAGVLYNLTQLENITMNYNGVELKLQPQSLSELPSLKNLILETMKIKTLPKDLLTGNTALEKLSLSHNEITTLPEGLLKDLKSLVNLDLSFNKIKEVSMETFSSLKKLKFLNLNRNYLEILPDYLFSGLTNLETVTIDHNFLHTITPSAFQGARLKTLSLAHNKLTLLDQEQAILLQYSNFDLHSPFNKISELKKLVLSENEINYIFQDWKTVLLRLEELDLSYNKFSEIDFFDIQFFANNITIDLRHNNISSVRLNPGLLPDHLSLDDEQTSNRKILIDNNPLNCDCGLYPLSQRLQGAKSLVAEAKFVIGDVRCQSPENLKGKLFKTVSPFDLKCDLPDEYCPKRCDCEMIPATSTLNLECISLPQDLPAPEKLGAKYLTLKLMESPQCLNNLNIHLLNLTGLGLKDIPFGPLGNVTEIDLSNNNLSNIPTRFLSSNTSLYLSGNPFECDCWHSNEVSMLQNTMKVKDLNLVTCDDGTNLIKIDVLSLCSTFKAAVVATVTFIVLLILLIIISIAVYRNRNEVFIYLSRIFPCIFQDDLTDIDKEYDIFISYAHKDLEYFKKLLPRLENDFKQKTCLHYRDWDVGDMIPEQINRSVQQSRRTIILLSKNFLESTYANMEFKSAHNYALQEGKTRVILILLDEDVTNYEKLSEELKAYIKTNTYLTWDDQRFWERLRKALPRKNAKKFIWHDIFAEKKPNGGLDVQLNSDGKLVNLAAKEDV